ncbi:2-oxo acid dehydrogenase subunit E2 [Candidatus Aerophobetes bacterium]|nr:2-oxo acid dehydrogenase subunit E2 [Candidatus Aerophobetes bacterium]
MVTKVIMPKLGETMEEGEIVKWLKKEGDRVKEGEPLLEIATDKANMEVEATTSGMIRKIVAQEGQIVPVTQTIAYITDSMDEEIPLKERGKVEVETPAKAEKEIVPIKASPLAKKLAKEKKVDLSTIKGTGPGGRIVKEDVLRAAQKKEVKEEGAPLAKEEFSLSRIEKIMAQRMQESKKQIPHFYLTSEVNFSEAVRFRNDLLEEFEKEKGVHLSYTDLLIKACARALSKFPRINSHFKEEKVVSFSRINIGLAVATEKGLVVPVIKDVDKKDIFQIAKDRMDVVNKANENKLTLEEVEGATFTLSNLGMMEVKTFAAIINPPQVAILATGEIKEKPVVIKEKIVVTPIMEMTLSCDHRAVDGYIGAKFLQEVKRGLEKPSLLLM